MKKVRFVIEISYKCKILDELKARIYRAIDDTRVESLETAESEVIDLINKFNEEEKKKRPERAEYRKLLHIINEDKLLKCPTELIYDSYLRQEYQGNCPVCGYKFIEFFNRGEQQPENFKYCHGFGQSRIKDDTLVIVFECPECFEKSHFHCNDNWYDLYGEWIVDNSIFLKDKS